MVKIEFYDDLDNRVIDSMLKQHVNMDNWDFVLFIPDCYEHVFDVRTDDGAVEVEPKSYYLSRLVTVMNYGEWYKVKNFNGSDGYLGVAYHG